MVLRALTPLVLDAVFVVEFDGGLADREAVDDFAVETCNVFDTEPPARVELAPFPLLDGAGVGIPSEPMVISPMLRTGGSGGEG